jgi:hypothetical protein
MKRISCRPVLALAGPVGLWVAVGTILVTLALASPAMRVGASSPSPDTFTLTPIQNHGSSTDQNLWAFDDGGVVTWGAYTPCQLTGATTTYTNGSSQSFGPTTTTVTAPPGIGVSRVEVTGIDCTNTVGAIGITANPNGGGYYIGDNNGYAYSYGSGGYPTFDTGSDTDSTTRIVGIAEEKSGNGPLGYLQVTPTGGVFAIGALFYGNVSGQLNAPIVGIAATADGGGYWLVAADGGVFAFGDAKFEGSVPGVLKPGQSLNQPVVGIAADDATGGYWVVAADGGIFSFNAPFYGSTGSIKLNKPIVGMEAAPDGSGYRFVASDGGVFCFNLPFEGSLGADPPSSPVVGMAPSGTDGYWLVEHNNAVQPFGTARTLPFQILPT